MNRMKSATLLAVIVCVVWPCEAAGAESKELAKLLRVMPSDFPMVVVVQDMAELDRTISTIRKRFAASSDEATIVTQMKEEIGVAQWADLGKPMGVGVPAFGGAEWQGVLWFWIDDFANKAKGLSGATETDGVWELPFEGKETLFARVMGEYVAISNTKQTLERASKNEQPLTEAGGRVRKLLGEREAWIRLNVEPVRNKALGGVAQAAQMAPMFAMMAGTQGGADPAVLTGLVTALMDGAKKYVEQIDVVDVVIGLTESEANVTLATTYKDGAIKGYLAKQEPASVPLLKHVEEQPYFLALGYHIPGDASPFFDYMLRKVNSAMTPPPQPGADAKTADGMKEALETMRALFKKMEGQTMVMGMASDGMRVVGDYVGKDPIGLREAVKQSFIVPNPLMSQFNAGATYEALDSKKIGSVLVDQFALKVDTTNPAAANMLAMYGGSPRMSLGVVGDRVRYCMGAESPLQRVFAEKVEKPFASNEYVTKALSALPTKRNAIIVIDPVGFLPLIGPMMGKPPTGDVPLGPPIAISVSLSGEPARVDIHVPFRAIERTMQAFGSEEPL